MIKLLVIDDENGVCDVIQKTFSYIGFTVLTATTKEKALRILKKEKPGIVFLDLVMPDVEGLSLLKELKALDPSVIVIVVTAKDAATTKAEAMESGADEYIQKPFSHNYLRDVVVEKIKGLLDKGGQMQKPRILLVDDEAALRQSIRSFIQPRFSCEIEEASHGGEALDKVKSLQPDLVLLDIKMPGLSGLDIIGEIKKTSPRSQVVILSAWQSAEVVSKAVESGASDYITKPVSLVLLGEKLKMIFLSMGKLIQKKSV